MLQGAIIDEMGQVESATVQHTTADIWAWFTDHGVPLNQVDWDGDNYYSYGRLVS